MPSRSPRARRRRAGARASGGGAGVGGGVGVGGVGASAAGGAGKRPGPLARAWRRIPPERRRGVGIALVAVAILIVLAVIAVVGVAVNTWRYSAFAQPPAVGTTVLAPPTSHAAQALADLEMSDDERAATEYLAAQPTAYWLTPEQDPIGTAGDTVTSLASEARSQEAALAIVVYGLPDRDCGNFSAGGLSEEDYPRWIAEISGALRTAADLTTIVVLEPDSLALAPDCGNAEARQAHLREAAEQLAGPNTWIYLDGGHSNWLPAAEMAELLNGVGAGDAVRGFATNVSNYQHSADEFAYAREVSERTGGLHALVDTSRNGAASAGSEWCNPPDQRVGEPTGTFGDDIVDTNLWIKPPGESDGTCNGGPAAGQWWPEAAEELTRDVR
jgi:endoglucanase